MDFTYSSQRLPWCAHGRWVKLCLQSVNFPDQCPALNETPVTCILDMMQVMSPTLDTLWSLKQYHWPFEKDLNTDTLNIFNASKKKTVQSNIIMATKDINHCWQNNKWRTWCKSLAVRHFPYFGLNSQFSEKLAILWLAHLLQKSQKRSSITLINEGLN